MSAAISGCSRKQPVLHICSWTDYINPGLLSKFEQQYNCRILMDYYDSNEMMYRKFTARPKVYDLIIPSSYMVSILQENNLLQPLDHDRIPNLKYIDPKYLPLADDPDMDYGVPYMISVTGVGYIKDGLEQPNPSWGIFNRKDLAGRMTMLDDMRETIGAALKYLGYSLNSTNDAELAEAAEVLTQWKNNIAKFESDQYKNGLITMKSLAAQGYSGDIAQGIKDNPRIGFFIPKEGTSIACDEMVIPRFAPESELAHQFINFMLNPAHALKNMEYVFYLAPNTQALQSMNPAMRNNPAFIIDLKDLTRSEVIRDLGVNNSKYEKLWKSVRFTP
jgi:spermidine/putrescine transport system substrate-binding protein